MHRSDPLFDRFAAGNPVRDSSHRCRWPTWAITSAVAGRLDKLLWFWETSDLAWHEHGFNLPRCSIRFVSAL
jgi:hypothetical protein